MSEKKKTGRSAQFHSKSSISSQVKRSHPKSHSSDAGFSSSAGRNDAHEEEAFASRVARVRSRWEELAGQASLTSLFGRLEALNGKIGTLKTRLAEIRRRGYVFGNDLEIRAAELQQRWSEQHPGVLQLLEEQREVLARAVHGAEQVIRRIGSSRSAVAAAESRLDSIANTLRRAESRVADTFDTTEGDVLKMENQLAKLEFLLDSLESASFKLYPDEHGVAICRAVWVSDREEPKGLLFLTDGRLIFEQREKKATKRVLFITTQSKLVQEKLWETPVGALEEVEIQDEKKFLSSKELLTLRSSRRTREFPGEVTVQLKEATNELWKSLVSRVQSGDIAKEKVGASSSKVQEADASSTVAEDLPTQCPACGAKLPPIFKGMHEVSCEYCGTVVRF